MKKTITNLAIALSFATALTTQAQTAITFDTFTLSPNTYYQDNSSADFSNNGVTFQYGWNTSFGGYWESGTAYTNLNDTVNGTYTNLYGAITGSAFSGNNYATTQSGAVISFSNNTTAVTGFYITNTTYAWKEIKNGGFGRKFGDTTGTGSGASITQGDYPDWFKILVRGYRGGALLSDSVEFYLADYRSSGTLNDYAVKNWQYVNCISLGQVDSITFQMKSSDNNAFGMKTPAFFSIDNFVIQSTVGVEELQNLSNFSVFPNPANRYVMIRYDSNLANELSISISDITGKEVHHQISETNIGNNILELNIETLEAGIYFISINDDKTSKTIKLIKY